MKICAQEYRAENKSKTFVFSLNSLSMPCTWASLVAQIVKNPLAMRETWVQSLAWEDPLEKGMATHSSILAWRIPWTQEPGELSPGGGKESHTAERGSCGAWTSDLTLHSAKART